MWNNFKILSLSLLCLLLRSHQCFVNGLAEFSNCVDTVDDELVIKKCAKFCPGDDSPCKFTNDVNGSGQKFTFCHCENLNSTNLDCSTISKMEPETDNDQNCQVACDQVTMSSAIGEDEVIPMTSFYCVDHETEREICICGLKKNLENGEDEENEETVNLRGRRAYIKGPEVADKGNWGPLEKCHKGQYVSGFELKVQQHQGDDLDDNGVTAIGFMCKKLVSLMKPRRITSVEFALGDWSEAQYCKKKKRAVGFQLRSQGDQGDAGDDFAVTDFRLLCDHEEDLESTNGLDDVGDWTEEQKCPKRTYLCGLRTLIDECDDCTDSSAINNVMGLCCP